MPPPTRTPTCCPRGTSSVPSTTYRTETGAPRGRGRQRCLVRARQAFLRSQRLARAICGGRDRHRPAQNVVMNTRPERSGGHRRQHDGLVIDAEAEQPETIRLQPTVAVVREVESTRVGPAGCDADARHDRAEVHAVALTRVRAVARRARDKERVRGADVRTRHVHTRRLRTASRSSDRPFVFANGLPSVRTQPDALPIRVVAFWFAPPDDDSHALVRTG